MIKNLQEARKSSGYTLDEVTTMIKISVKCLVKYENDPGKTPVDVYVKLLSLYNIPINKKRE